MYTVTVLTPKGRRQQVKVTPNTTILQILEEVCSKHGLKPEEYDIRHHNKILDTSSMFRFTSLTNNAQLEMTEAIKRRQESSVTLGVQFETGERHTGTFTPSENIWNVIMSLKPEGLNLSNLVVIYMRQEIYGNESLQKTTLRSLGLTGGRAMLRVINRSPEELRVQANVSSTLSRTPLSSETEEKTGKKSPESLTKVKGKTPSPEPARNDKNYLDPSYFKGNMFENLFKSEKAKRASEDKMSVDSSDFSSNYSNVHMQEVNNFTESKNKYEPVSKTVENNEPSTHSNAILLGERNAVAYNLNSVKPKESEEEPEGFFDLTIQDAKLLLKQAKQLCADLEEAPLMTSAQREFEKDKKILSLLHQYKKTVLRIKFPDRTVLQGTFSPLETVSAVEKFVCGYLETPLPFYLYTTPPKVILKSDTRLIECGCVPSCVLYFGMPSTVSPPSQFLKSEVLNKLSSPSAAALQAYETWKVDRKLEETDTESLSEVSEKRGWVSQSSEAGPSGNQKWEGTRGNEGKSSKMKIPKWFRPNK